MHRNRFQLSEALLDHWVPSFSLFSNQTNFICNFRSRKCLFQEVLRFHPACITNIKYPKDIFFNHIWGCSVVCQETTINMEWFIKESTAYIHAYILHTHVKANILIFFHFLLCLWVLFFKCMHFEYQMIYILNVTLPAFYPEISRESIF